MDIDIRKALTQSDAEGNIRVTVNVWDSDTPELRAIITEHFPTWAELFARKNSEYGSGSAFDLGERGQFSDIYRKIIKLKRAMWDEDESVLTTESVDEILMDLIGHCFLTLEMRARRTRPAGLGDGEQKMSREEFERLVVESGFFLAKAVPNESRSDLDAEELESLDESQKTISSWTHEPSKDGRHTTFRLNDLVRYKQHLGQGEVFRITGFDPQADYGKVVQIESVEGEMGTFAHPAWLHLADEPSLEEQQLAVSEGTVSPLATVAPNEVGSGLL